MHPTLTVILPVHNAQQRLSARVAELLEITSELTPHFDLIIVDDGSTDQTVEIARELSREFPQIQVIRHDSRQGRLLAVESAKRLARGEVVIVQDELLPASPSRLRRVWNRRVDPRAAVPHVPSKLAAFDAPLVQDCVG